MKVLSICGGLETGYLALQELGIPVEEYHTYEIFAPAIELSKKHFPNIVHHGDVIGADFSQFKGLIWLWLALAARAYQLFGKKIKMYVLV